jgi:hypothetical protein
MTHFFSSIVFRYTSNCRKREGCMIFGSTPPGGRGVPPSSGGPPGVPPGGRPEKSCKSNYRASSGVPRVAPFSTPFWTLFGVKMGSKGGRRTPVFVDSWYIKGIHAFFSFFKTLSCRSFYKTFWCRVNSRPLFRHFSECRKRGRPEST